MSEVLVHGKHGLSATPVPVHTNVGSSKKDRGAAPHSSSLQQRATCFEKEWPLLGPRQMGHSHYWVGSTWPTMATRGPHQRERGKAREREREREREIEREKRETEYLDPH